MYRHRTEDTSPSWALDHGPAPEPERDVAWPPLIEQATSNFRPGAGEAEPGPAECSRGLGETEELRACERDTDVCGSGWVDSSQVLL